MRTRAVVWGGAALLSTGVLVYAFNPQPDPPGHYYGLMTIDAGQRVSVHVANTKRAVDAFRPPRSVCTARLEVVDACGAPLARHVTRLGPGASKSLNFTMPTDRLPPGPCADPAGVISGTDSVTSDPPSGAEPPEPDRHRVRAQVVFSGEAMHCISSVEVGDPFGNPPGGRTGSDPPGERTGGSGFIHPGLIVGFNPQPDPPGAPTRTPR
jgi:hypothetical protein